MADKTKEEFFVETVERVNRCLIILGIFFLLYFLLKTQVDIYLFLLSLFSCAFAWLSHKHLMITQRMVFELRRAKEVLEEVKKSSHIISDVK